MHSNVLFDIFSESWSPGTLLWFHGCGIWGIAIARLFFNMWLHLFRIRVKKIWWVSRSWMIIGQLCSVLWNFQVFGDVLALVHISLPILNLIIWSIKIENFNILSLRNLNAMSYATGFDRVPCSNKDVDCEQADSSNEEILISDNLT